MSEAGKYKKMETGLPYINNFWVIASIALFNLAMAFIFQYGRIITKYDFITDAAVCGAVTSLITVAYIYFAVKKLRARGALPKEVPVSLLMQRLPKDPVMLALLFSIAFAALMAFISISVAWFFEIREYPFARFAVWKIIYSCILSAKTIELVILRYVQPDCAAESDPKQNGAETVKNPLPCIETFKNLFNTVVNDFGLNMLSGLLFGGTVISDHSIIIQPTTSSGIIIGGLILGVLVTFLMTLPTADEVRAISSAGNLPPLEKRSICVAWMPERPIFFALALLPPIMLISALALWAILTFFGFETLNFFQYFIVRTVYVSLLSKPVNMITVLRYRQPLIETAAGNSI